MSLFASTAASMRPESVAPRSSRVQNPGVDIGRTLSSVDPWLMTMRGSPVDVAATACCCVDEVSRYEMSAVLALNGEATATS